MRVNKFKIAHHSRENSASDALNRAGFRDSCIGRLLYLESSLRFDFERLLVLLKDRPLPIPPILFIHGAANGAWVWEGWRRQLTSLGHQPIVLDLRGHGRSLPVDFSTITMDDYVADVESVTGQVTARFGQHPIIAGWSMGGLIAMMYAARHPETPGLILFAPSPPVEVGGRADPEKVRATPTIAFGPELYGLYPQNYERSRRALKDLTEDEAKRVLANSDGALESGFARRQRQRGISIPADSISCPSILIHGESDTAISPENSAGVAAYLGAELVSLPEAGHWAPVYGEECIANLAPLLDGWLRRCCSTPESSKE
jgi:pimeloyl-ACP methyl ester carboxylesterase